MFKKGDHVVYLGVSPEYFDQTLNGHTAVVSADFLGYTRIKWDDTDTYYTPYSANLQLIKIGNEMETITISFDGESTGSDYEVSESDFPAVLKFINHLENAYVDPRDGWTAHKIQEIDLNNYR